MTHPKTLICVGSYTIGKERIFMALAEAIDTKIFASTEKAKILKTLQVLFLNTFTNRQTLDNNAKLGLSFLL